MWAFSSEAAALRPGSSVLAGRRLWPGDLGFNSAAWTGPWDLHSLIQTESRHSPHHLGLSGFRGSICASCFMLQGSECKSRLTATSLVWELTSLVLTFRQ